MKALGQVEAWGEVAADVVCVVAWLQALGDIAYARAVVRESHTILEHPVF